MRVRKADLLAFIRSRGSVTFEDIEEFFRQKGCNFQGDTAISLKKSNLVVWHGWNHRTCKTFLELVADGRIWLDSVSMGQAPTPPIFRNITGLSQAEFIPVLIKAR